LPTADLNKSAIARFGPEAEVSNWLRTPRFHTRNDATGTQRNAIKKANKTTAKSANQTVIPSLITIWL
jgi:hypothetical protein